MRRSSRTSAPDAGRSTRSAGPLLSDFPTPPPGFEPGACGLEDRLPGERTAYAIKTYHSAKWANTREKVLNRDPICKVCDAALSEQVDHITPLSQGGARYTLTNLQGICVRCHAIKSARESR